MIDTDNFRGDAYRSIVTGVALLLPQYFLGMSQGVKTFMGAAKQVGKNAVAVYIAEEVILPMTAGSAIQTMGGGYGTINYMNG